MNSELKTDTSIEQMHAMLENQRQAFVREGHVSAETRIRRLGQALDLVWDNQDEISKDTVRSLRSSSGEDR